MTGLIKTKEEIQAMREGGKILARILKEIADKVAPAVTTAFLNEEAEKLIVQAGARPAFLGYRPPGSSGPYPAALCTSINDEIVHALPSQRKLREGDIVGLDLGIWYGEMCVDAALTVGVGKISNTARRLIDVAKRSLELGVAAVKSGARVGDIGNAIEKFVAGQGFAVIKELAGHGVGYTPHEDPLVFNYGRKGAGIMMEAGMTLAIEPMVAEGDWHIKIDPDGWGIKTADGKLAAHFEHTVLVTEKGCEVLTKI